jgi:hypothetical protein
MVDLLMNFSHTQCIAICAVLVPANLAATAQSLLMVGLQRSQMQLRLITSVACVYAIMMMLHVASWFMIGVVMVQTFILLGLGLTCLSVNLWAIARPRQLRAILTTLYYHLLPLWKLSIPSTH